MTDTTKAPIEAAEGDIKVLARPQRTNAALNPQAKAMGYTIAEERMGHTVILMKPSALAIHL